MRSLIVMMSPQLGQVPPQSMRRQGRWQSGHHCWPAEALAAFVALVDGVLALGPARWRRGWCGDRWVGPSPVRFLPAGGTAELLVGAAGQRFAADPAGRAGPGRRRRRRRWSASCQDVEAEVAAAFNPFVVLLGQDGADEADQRGAVGEDPDDVGGDCKKNGVWLLLACWPHGWQEEDVPDDASDRAAGAEAGSGGGRRGRRGAGGARRCAGSRSGRREGCCGSRRSWCWRTLWKGR